MENLRELFQLMTRNFGFLNKTCCRVGNYDLSLIQSQILYEINRQHKPSIQQIAETLGTDITTFSRQVQSLVKLSMIEKTPDPDDRRVYILSLTTEGKYVATRIDQKINAYLKEFFSHMNEFERETVTRSIKLLNDAMVKSKKCCTTPLGKFPTPK